jgi:hypothetical protein
VAASVAARFVEEGAAAGGCPASRPRLPHGTVASSRSFVVVLVALIALSIAPFWRSELLPLQDYPQFLVLAQAHGGAVDPTSAFFGTYARGYPLSPLLLPILLVRALAALSSFETAGRVLWSLYAAALPLASLHLLRVLRRDRWAVLLVFPLVPSYWVLGGFIAFATAMPLVVLGLAFSVHWLEAPTPRRGALVAGAGVALHLWHALALAQLVGAFLVLWLLGPRAGRRARVLALAPLAPPLALFAAWLAVVVLGGPPGSRPPSWVPVLDAADHFLEYIGPTLPHAGGALVLAALVLAGGALVRRTAPPPGPFRVATPFAWLAFVAALSTFALPSSCFGVEGIADRMPWLAALFVVFAWDLPSAGAARAAFLGVVAGGTVLGLVLLGRRFAAYDAESRGASRLIDRIGPGETLLAPMLGNDFRSIPHPAKPGVATALYATLRKGGLPNASFAGYDINLVHYKDGVNPMPGIGLAFWRTSPALARFDHVLLRSPPRPPVAPRAGEDLLFEVARDGDWVLYDVCGSRARPRCD